MRSIAVCSCHSYLEKTNLSCQLQVIWVTISNNHSIQFGQKEKVHFRSPLFVALILKNWGWFSCEKQRKYFFFSFNSLPILSSYVWQSLFVPSQAVRDSIYKVIRQLNKGKFMHRQTIHRNKSCKWKQCFGSIHKFKRAYGYLNTNLLSISEKTCVTHSWHRCNQSSRLSSAL